MGIGNGYVKITHVFVPILPYPNYPHIAWCKSTYPGITGFQCLDLGDTMTLLCSYVW